MQRLEMLVSTELEASVKTAIVNVHYVLGSIFFIFNMLVSCLIFFDTDVRGSAYRKYLLSLQLSSSAMDVLLNLYNFIVQANCQVVFSESRLAEFVEIVPAIVGFIYLFFTVIVAYFRCVYFRRCVVLPPGSPFCFTGWRRILLFCSLETCALGITAGALRLGHVSRVNEEDIPDFLSWVIEKPSYIVYHVTWPIFIAAAAIIVLLLCVIVVTAVMIAQVLNELKHGMQHASALTKQYQRRAIVSLIFQGTIPTCCYLLPAVVLGALIVNTLFMDLETAAQNQTYSAASAIAISSIFTHTFAHSLTVICCSPAYRKTIQGILPKCARKKDRRLSRSVAPLHL